MLLSIVIPSHNKASYLKKAINSIIKDNQFGNNINLILSDNSFNSEIKELYNNYFASNKIAFPNEGDDFTIGGKTYKIFSGSYQEIRYYNSKTS